MVSFVLQTWHSNFLTTFVGGPCSSVIQQINVGTSTKVRVLNDNYEGRKLKRIERVVALKIE